MRVEPVGRRRRSQWLVRLLLIVVLLAVPVLMLLDYLLTILGAKASVRVYRRHFVVPNYELNPLWQESVRKQRWLNPRHLAIVCFATGLLLCFDRWADVPAEFWRLLLPLATRSRLRFYRDRPS